MTPYEQLSRAASDSGCELADVNHDGLEVSFTVLCPSHQSKLLLLQRLGELDAEDAFIRRRAMQVASDHGGDRLATLLALHAYVRDGVVFCDEPVETFASARETLEYQVGDCDDSARALLALLTSIGYRCRMTTLGDPPTHVACQVMWDGRWEWLETTLAAFPGEHPLEALERLGVDDRPDLVG